MAAENERKRVEYVDYYGKECIRHCMGNGDKGRIINYCPEYNASTLLCSKSGSECIKVQFYRHTF